MRTLLSLCVIYFVAVPLRAQVLGMDLLQGKDKIDIPFEMQQGFIMVDVRFHKTLPLRFIFDTGAEHTILFKREFSDLLGIPYSKRIPIVGSDLSRRMYALIARNVYLELGGTPLVRRDIVVMEKNLALLDEVLGLNVDGIIGGSYFRGLTVKINYRRKRITIYDPRKFEPPGKKFSSHEIEIIRNKPYLTSKITLLNDTIVNSRLLIDTGAALAFLLHANTDTSLTLPKMIVRGNVGYGISGEISGYHGKIKMLEIGDYTFPNLLTSFQDVDLSVFPQEVAVRNGILGNLLLSRFEVIIDYHRNTLHLKPHKKFNKAFNYDKSGLTIYAIGEELNEFYVRDVVPGSPAFEADIRPGDVIKKIQWFKSRHWSLERLHRLLQKKNGKCIKMIIERNGEKLKKRFRLRDWFLDDTKKT